MKKEKPLTSPASARLIIVPTGLAGLDTILGGGMVVGSLIVLVGQPGTGKTTLLQQLCFKWPTLSPSSGLPSPSQSKPTDPDPDHPTDTAHPVLNQPTFNQNQHENENEAVEGEKVLVAAGTEAHKPVGAGAGKSRLAVAKALYFSTLSEPHDKVIAHISSFDFFDPAKLNTSVVFLSLTEVMEQEADPKKVTAFIVSNARREKAGLIAIDGLGALLGAFSSIQDARYFFNQLSAQLNILGITAIMTLEQNVINGDLDGLLTGVDGVIVLANRSEGAGEIHRVAVQKLRGMARLEGWHSYSFSQRGLTFYPRLEAIVSSGPTQADEETEQETELDQLLAQPSPDDPSALAYPNLVRLGFGLPELEKMLEGGLPLYSSTFVAGSPGVGKTLLGLHYLMAGVAKGEVGLYVGFYEQAASLIYKAARFNLDLNGAIRSGQVKLLTFSPVELNPDKLGTLITQAVETYGVKRVVIDGILELEIACRPEGRSRNYTTALDTYFKQQKVSSLYTYTISKLIGSELDLSETVFTALAENLLLLRQVAYRSRLYRLVSVLKMRDSLYDMSIREFAIETSVGIRILEPLESNSTLMDGLAHDLSETSAYRTEARQVAGSDEQEEEATG